MSAKDQKTYWKNRVSKRTYTHEGKTKQTAEYYARMQWGGKRKWVALGTGNADTAAGNAAKKYITLTEGGWDALEKRKISGAEKITIGDFLYRLGEVSRVAARTRGLYERSLRQIAGEIKGWDSPSGKNFKWEPHREWRAKVDALKLSVVSQDAVAKWIKSYVEKRSKDPEKRRKAQNSCNTHLRNAKALFNDDLLKLAKLETLENPFEGLKGYSVERRRYQSNFDVVHLIQTAGEKLMASKAEKEKDYEYLRRREAYKALILFGFTAIRRKEADLLLWDQIDLNRGNIEIRRTKYFAPKADSSIGQIGLDEDALGILRGFRAQAPKDEFVLAGHRPRPDRTYSSYRCQKTFRFLTDWLRKYEDEFGNCPLEDSQKPLHTIRKEIGAIIATNSGIFAAQGFLRHAEISTTEKYYADQKEVITPGLKLAK